MKALWTLIKLASAEVDEKRLVLRERLEREDALRADLATLETNVEIERERAPALADASYAYGAFGAAASHRREVLQRDLAQAGAAVEAAREDLAVSFERQKRYEITDENRRRRDAVEMRRRETIDADERGVQGHSRRRTER